LVFVPGYNVSKTIGSVIKQLIKLRSVVNFDILYIDNNSEDNSVKIVSSMKRKFIEIKVNKKNIGYGGSQKEAFKFGFMKKYDFLVEFDGDMQYSAGKIPHLIDEIIKGYCVVFGVRTKSSKNYSQMPFWKYLGNKISSKIINWSLDIDLHEIHTGFRAYDLKRLKKVKFSKCHNDYRWTIDSVIEIVKINKNFSEIGVKGKYGKYSKSPRFIEIIKTLTYMIFRSVKYKLIKK